MASTAGSAERLQKASGAWRLEFQQLVYNSPILLRPKRFAVQGEQAILQQLRELSGHEPLVRDTERLFRGTIPDGTYVAREGRWCPELVPETLPDPEPEQDQAQELSESSERGRLLLEELARRMIALERNFEQLQDKLDESLSAISAAAASGALAAQARTETAAASTAGVEPQAVPAPEEAPAVEASAAPAAAGPPSKGVSLPTMNALTDLIRGLAGPEGSLASSDRTDWGAISSGGTPVYFAVIQDNAGDEAGSMIFDLECALRLAGALLMESEEVIESLLEEKVMSDEMLDAASEVCNTLTSALNKVSGNPHLRSGKMQPFTDARAAQLATAAKRDDYRYNQGGRLSLVAC